MKIHRIFHLGFFNAQIENADKTHAEKFAW